MQCLQCTTQRQCKSHRCNEWILFGSGQRLWRNPRHHTACDQGICIRYCDTRNFVHRFPVKFSMLYGRERMLLPLCAWDDEPRNGLFTLVDGTQDKLEPVSNNTENSWAGEPIFTVPTS